MILQDGHVPLEKLLPIIDQAALALAYAHDASKHPNVGVVYHRDIKSEHVIVDDNGKVVLIDWDVSKSKSVGTTAYTAKGAGTRNYQTVEAMLGHNSEDDELYALGFVFAEAALGEIPQELALSRGGKPYSFPDWIPEPVRKVFEKAVHPKESERYHNTTEFRMDLGLSALTLRQESSNLENQTGLQALKPGTYEHKKAKLEIEFQWLGGTIMVVVGYAAHFLSSEVVGSYFN